jgi:hypothetical protein
VRFGGGAGRTSAFLRSAFSPSPVKDKPSFLVGSGMEIPSITDPMGLFDILIWAIVLLAAVILAVLLVFGTF